jgi:hypothetical protein
MRFAPLTRMADNVMIYKYVVKNVARQRGMTATFMPKPLFGDNGSGMHVHQSIWKGERPLFAGDGYAGSSGSIQKYFRYDSIIACRRPFAEFCNMGVIPGSSQTKARESALQERIGPASCGPATMESGNDALCRTGRVVKADIDLCREPGGISRARGRGRFRS